MLGFAVIIPALVTGKGFLTTEYTYISMNETHMHGRRYFFALLERA